MTQKQADIRTRCVRIATFLGGLYFFLYFVAPQSVVSQFGIDKLDEPISNGLSIVGTMAFGLGLLNIVSAHGMRLAFGRAGWFYSLTLLGGLVSTVVITTSQWMESVSTSRQIRSVQIVGEFAARIKDDAAVSHGGVSQDVQNARIIKQSGDVPLVPTRVAALVRYAESEVATMRNVVAHETHRDLRDAGTTQLIRELDADLSAFTELVRELSAESSRETTMTPGQESLLERVSRDSTKIASTYALIIRADRNHALSQRLYDLLYNGLFNQLGSAMFALLGVYIAAAAYRAFRIRSIESALMMTAALVVMMGQISFGRMLSEELPSMRQWLLEVPNSAAFRAIRLGAGVAGLLLAIRMWLSIESSTNSSEHT